MPSRLEVALDRQLERRQVQFLQAPRLGASERFIGDVRERRSAPERECAVCAVRRAAVLAVARGLPDERRCRRRRR
jgi:hypothetical protein